jgi:protease-4
MMSLAVDEILDRRRLRRRLSFWRIVALVFLVGIIISLFYAAGLGSSLSKKASPHIARVFISGFITEDRKLIKLIGKIKDDENVKGVIVKIDSPGGATVGGEAIFEAVRALAKEKPTVASVGGLAASAGYMIASASDHIVARRSSLVGSIGVLFQYPDVSKLLDMVGVKMEEIKSSPLKAEPSPFHPAKEEAKEVLRELIKDSFGWFRDLVKERRGMSDAEIDAVATGRIFSGAQGKLNKLIDEIGGEEVARKWLIDEKGLSSDLKTIDWKPARNSVNLLSATSLLAWFNGNSDVFGAASELKRLQKLLRERIFLDGMLSVWQAPSVNSVKEGKFR